MKKMQIITKDMINMIAESFVSVFNSEPWNDSWTKEQAVERLTDIYETPKFEGAIEVIEGQIIGVIMGHCEQYYDGLHFHILEFWVNKDMQRNGIGTKLLTDFTDYLKSNKIVNHYLITKHGKNTEGFYKKNGYNANENLCVMSKSIK